MQQGLTLKSIKINLEAKTLVDIDCHVSRGEVFTIMGSSGSGKSSLLNLIGGFLPSAFDWSGDVHLDAESILSLPAHRRRVGTLFQDALLFPHMSVGSNLMFGLPPNIKGHERKQRVDTALEEIELQNAYQRDPATLSGGQRARVALARLLLSEPRALLLDEPFSKLDAALRGQMRNLVFNAARSRDLPVILVTHDEVDAEAAGGVVFRI